MTETSTAPKVCVIGAGTISDYHIAGLQAAGAEVALLINRTLDKAVDKASQYGISNVGDSLDDLWSATDIAGAIIATPDSTHLEIALNAISHGMPVMIQKPLATTSAECKAILEAGAKAGVPVYVSFMHRYFEEVAALKELLTNGTLGNVLHIRLRNATPGAGWAPWFYDSASVGGGAHMQLGVHGIDLIRFIFGEISSVRATIASQVGTRTLDSGEVIEPAHEDFVAATYQLRSGAIATHEVSYNEVVGTDRFRMEVYGTKATAWLRTQRGRLAFSVKGEEDSWQTPLLAATPLGQLHHRHFLDMLSGVAPHDGSGADGLASVLIAETTYVAAQQPPIGINQ
jgi:predicted dehydrogenase